MTRLEKIFFILWGMVIFPLLLILLVMIFHFDKDLVNPFLIFMGTINGVYLGARGFENWTNTPEDK